MVQGTEPAASAQRARLWGFVQPEYQNTDGSDLEAGPFAGTPAIFNQLRPDLKSDSGFNIIRARVGVRGVGGPTDPRVNYFVLLEAGNNGITNGSGSGVKVTDASITLNHFKGARVRAGLFKTPGSEEGLQAIHVFDYINFTNGTNTLLLERFFTSTNGGGADANRPNGSVGAFRDVGVQVFDAFKTGDWETSYALMVGTGNGLNRGDNNDALDSYAYISTERVFDGAGPRRQGWKLFGWLQNGERTLHHAGMQQDFDRTRWGVGTTYRRGKWRGAFEYIYADGMIFNGTRGAGVPGTVNAGGVVADFQVLPEDEADAWYVDVGYKITTKIELDLRYDLLNRGTKTRAGEREFSTVTVGAQYFLNKKSRILLNYEFRDAQAPGLPGGSVPNRILDGMENRISAQLLVIF